MNRDERCAALSQKIIFAAFRIALPTAEARISGIQDIVEAITDANASRFTRREVTRQLEAAADKLAMRLAAFEEHEFRDLDDGDKAAAILAVCDAVDAVSVTKQTVIEENANADAILARLQPIAMREWAKAYISTDGIEYGRVFLIEASRFIVNIVRDMPDFALDVGIATLAIAKRILELLEQNIRLVVLPKYRAGTTTEIITFEADYRSDVIQRNKDVEIFGMPISVPELRRQPIDIAYITLSASFSNTVSQTSFTRSEPVTSDPATSSSVPAKARGIHPDRRGWRPARGRAPVGCRLVAAAHQPGRRPAAAHPPDHPEQGPHRPRRHVAHY